MTVQIVTYLVKYIGLYVMLGLPSKMGLSFFLLLVLLVKNVWCMMVLLLARSLCLLPHQASIVLFIVGLLIIWQLKYWVLEHALQCFVLLKLLWLSSQLPFLETIISRSLVCTFAPSDYVLDHWAPGISTGTTVLVLICSSCRYF